MGKRHRWPRHYLDGPGIAHGSQRPDCVAGHVRFELRNVVANYPFERAHGFPGAAEFRPQRLFAFELRRGGNAAGA